MEASIRKDESDENSHALDNPEFDADGVPVPIIRRQKIQNMNNEWKERMQGVIKGKDVLNEWEVYLLTLNLLVGSSNKVSYFMGMLRFILTVLILYADSTKTMLFILLSMIVFIPYVMITVAFPMIMRMGVAMYISDDDVMLALGWIIKPVRLCVKFIMLAVSKCHVVEKNNHEESTTKNVVLGCVSIEMVGVQDIAADGKSEQRRSVDDKLNDTVSPLHAGVDLSAQDINDFIPQSSTEQSIDAIPSSPPAISKSTLAAAAVDHHNEL